MRLLLIALLAPLLPAAPLRLCYDPGVPQLAFGVVLVAGSALAILAKRDADSPAS